MSGIINSSAQNVVGQGISLGSMSLSQHLAKICLILLVCASITAPAITIHQGLPWMKAEQLLLPVILVIYTWLLMAGLARLIRFNWMFLVGAIYTLSIILSIAYGADILRQSVILRDFYEIPKAWLPVVFFTLAYEAELPEESLRRLFAFFAAAVFFICLYAWGQWFGLGITHVLNTFYSGGEHIDVGLERYRRVYSTMGNANVLGQLMTWSIVAFTMAILFRVGSRARNVIVVFACLVTLAMTGSRYGLITTGFGIVLIVLLPSTNRRRRFAQLGILLVLLPVFGWTIASVASRNRATLDRLESLKNPFETDSFRKRLNVLWRDAGSDIAQSPFLGYGPAKTRFTGTFTDSEYLDVLKQFGIIGFLSYIAYYLFPLSLLWKGIRTAWRAGPFFGEWGPATFLTLCLSFVMVITALLMNVGESTFYNQLLQAFLWLWMGLGARSAKYITDVSSIPWGHSPPLSFRAGRGDPIKVGIRRTPRALSC